MSNESIYNEQQYAVYMVIYSGNMLPGKTNQSKITPRRYIGSTSIKNILSGYMGSVTSKKYGKIWRKEISNSFEKFNIRILSRHQCDVAAREEEKRIQIKYNVVRSDLYVNLAIASPNGFFGSPATGKIFTEETKKKMSISAIKRQTGSTNSFYGKTHSEETKEKIGAHSKKRAARVYKESMAAGTHPNSTGSCPNCGKIGQLRAMKRWHFDNCRIKIEEV